MIWNSVTTHYHSRLELTNSGQEFHTSHDVYNIFVGYSDDSR